VRHQEDARHALGECLLGQPARHRGGDAAGFDAFETVLGPIAQETVVGASWWRAYPAREAIERASRAIQANPHMTHCGNSACGQCRDAIAGGPILA
jgi:hypothetical protein